MIQFELSPTVPYTCMSYYILFFLWQKYPLNKKKIVQKNVIITISNLDIVVDSKIIYMKYQEYIHLQGGPKKIYDVI